MNEVNLDVGRTSVLHIAHDCTYTMSQQESRAAVAWKPRDAAAVLFG